jgi:hypothetical protein
MTASQFSFGDIGAFYHDFLSHHDGRGRGELQLEVFVRLVIGDGLRDDLRLEFILLAQPGHHFLEMLSGLAVGLIIKASDFKHGFLLFSIFFQKNY